MAKKILIFLISLPLLVQAQISFNGTGTCTYSSASGNLVISCPPIAVVVPVPTPTPTPAPTPTPTPTPPPVPAGCGSGQGVAGAAITGQPVVVRLPSGVIGSFNLPRTNQHSGMLMITDTTTTPNGAFVLDLMVSRCRGFIPSTQAEITAAGSCYIHSLLASNNAVKWVSKLNPAYSQYSSAQLDALGFCMALESDGQYYVNFRYTYEACNYGTCGETFTWYDSYY